MLYTVRLFPAMFFRMTYAALKAGCHSGKLDFFVKTIERGVRLLLMIRFLVLDLLVRYTIK